MAFIKKQPAPASKKKRGKQSRRRMAGRRVMTFRDTSNNNNEGRPGDENNSNVDIRNTVRKSVRSFLKRYGDNQPEDLMRVVLEEVEKPLLEEVLRFTGGNQCRSAQILGVSRGTLRARIQQYRL